ncbi:MAG: hypothetical protein ACREO7_03955 [Pseudoxanthomonas sp.]
MNSKLVYLLLTTTALLAMASASAPGRNPSAAAPTFSRTTELPAVSVRPAAEDAAWYQAHKIVDLDAILVRPDTRDLALFVADTVRTLDCLC